VNTIGIVAVAPLGGQDRVGASGGGDHRHFAVDQIGCQRRQSIRIILRKTVFDHDVPAFGVARFAQATTKRLH
jgi:hypothetical protein